MDATLVDSVVSTAYGRLAGLPSPDSADAERVVCALAAECGLDDDGFLVVWETVDAAVRSGSIPPVAYPAELSQQAEAEFDRDNSVGEKGSPAWAAQPAEPVTAEQIVPGMTAALCLDVYTGREEAAAEIAIACADMDDTAVAAIRERVSHEVSECYPAYSAAKDRCQSLRDCISTCDDDVAGLMRQSRRRLHDWERESMSKQQIAEMRAGLRAEAEQRKSKGDEAAQQIDAAQRELDAIQYRFDRLNFGLDVLCRICDGRARAAEEARRAAVAAERAANPLVLVVDQKSFAGVLKEVSPAMPGRSVNAALTYLHLTLADEHTTLLASNGDLTIERSIPLNGEPGDVYVPGAAFEAAVKGFGKGKLVISHDAEAVTVSRDAAVQRIPAVFELPHPLIPEITADTQGYSLPAGALKAALRNTAYAAERESITGAIRYTNGVLLHYHACRVDVVATDGYRLSLYRIPGVDTRDYDWSWLIPVRAAQALERLLPDDDEIVVSLAAASNQVLIEWPGFRVSTVVLDVKFPPYERVIPNEVTSKVHFAREHLTAALKAALPVCRNSHGNQVVDLCSGEGVADGKCRISASGERGEYSEDVDCERLGPDVRVALPPGFILDMLKSTSGDQVTLCWNADRQPVMFWVSREPSFTYIVMPCNPD